jgi:hypothetical protein
MSELKSPEKDAAVRECGGCGRRWHGGYDHCCACVQRRIDALELVIHQARHWANQIPEAGPVRAALMDIRL